MILFFNGATGKVVFDNRRPLPVKCLRFGTATPPAITEVVAPTAAEPQFVASSPSVIDSSVDKKVMTMSPQSGGNRFLRAVRRECNSEVALFEDRWYARRRRYNNATARNNARKRCQRRALRLEVLRSNFYA